MFNGFIALFFFFKENNSGTESNGHELFNYKMPLAGVVEPEERRMSVLSDWAPSVTSSVDTQV